MREPTSGIEPVQTALRAVGIAPPSALVVHGSLLVSTIDRMSTATPELPGAELLHAGLSDLHAGRESEAALVVQIAAPRLRTLGYNVPERSCVPGNDDRESPEHRLYALLTEERGAGAHSRYNALLSRIASFARAAAHTPAR